MNVVERCQKFGREGLTLLAASGETFEAAQRLHADAARITDGLSDKRLKTCEYAGGVLDVKTTCMVTLWNIYHDPSGWNDPEKRKAEAWAEVREILNELAGLTPIRTHARERAEWTDLWRRLWQRGDDKMREDVAKTALARYPDFDLAVLQESA